MLRRLSLIFCLAVLTACGNDDNSEPPAELVDFDHKADIDADWSVAATDGIGQHYLYLEPFIEGEQIATIGRFGQLSIVTASTGDLTASLELDIEISAGVGGDADHFYVASADGQLIAVDRRSLDIIWKSRVPSEILATPVASAGRVIVRTTDGRVMSFDSRDGSLNWSYLKAMPALTLRGSGKPILTRDVVIIGQEDGRLTALSIDEGESLWSVVLSTAQGRSETQRLIDIDGRSELYGHMLYAVGFQGRMAAIDVQRGQILWARPFSSETGLTVSGDVVYATDERGHIWAIDRFNGATLWKQDALTARRVTRPTVVDNNLWVGDYEGVVHVLSTFNGEFISRDHPGDEDNGILLSPIALGDSVLISMRDGEILSYRLSQRPAER